MIVMLKDMIEERYSHDEDWSWAMIVMLKDMIEENQIRLMNYST